MNSISVSWASTSCAILAQTHQHNKQKLGIALTSVKNLIYTQQTNNHLSEKHTSVQSCHSNKINIIGVLLFKFIQNCLFLKCDPKVCKMLFSAQS